MLPYLITFLFTLICFSLIEKNHSKCLKIFYLILTILIPSALAGLRDYNVGIDVRWYALDVFNFARNTKTFTYFINNIEIDKGYAVLAFVSAKIFDDAHGFLFMTELLIMTCITCSFLLLRKRIDTKLAMFLYLFFFYNYSLNIMRQSIAIALCSLAFSFLARRYRVITIAIMALAYFFHTSSCFFLLILLFVELMIISKEKYLNSIRVGYLILVILMFIGYLYIFSNLLNLDFLPSDYVRYVDDYGGASVSNMQYVMWSVELLLLIILYKVDNNKWVSFLFLVIFNYVLLYSLRLFVSAANRMALYPQIAAIILYAYVYALKYRQQLFKRNMVVYYKMLCVVAVWIWEFVIHPGGDTIPYSSKIFDLLLN